jgi:hypothetical protein
MYKSQSDTSNNVTTKVEDVKLFLIGCLVSLVMGAAHVTPHLIGSQISLT